MNQKVLATFLKDGTVEHFEYPPVNKCPHCDTSFDGKYISAHYHPSCQSGTESSSSFELCVVYFCHTCNHCFVGMYDGYRANKYNDMYFKLKNVYPFNSRKITFPETIKELSPSFVSIYNEAWQAEQRGLSSICGLGYRKSLEYLVKDYLIFRHPEEKEEILNTFLGNLIKDKLDNEKIKILASRSAWLGNDEAHYLKLHEGYDVQDLKQFINAMATFFDAELSVDKALGITPKK
ncbi:MAG: DUF4145 domain-containing protein [Oscillospiraceae bacterium]|nr:DUF4145 domain-containing protein [Oscillospiraceae bacterium]